MYIYVYMLPLQMYKVYKDPEGKRYLEEPTNHHASTIQRAMSMSNETEESYKKRIENLNEEIKFLNDELEKVVILRPLFNNLLFSIRKFQNLNAGGRAGHYHYSLALQRP